MSEWKKCRLDQIGRIVTGKTPKTSCPEYWDGEVPFVTPGDLQLSKHLLSTVRSVSLKGAESVKGAILPSGSICVSCIGVIGYVSMTTQVSVSNQQVNSIIVNDDFDADFVYYVLRNNWRAFKNMEGFSSVVSILNKSSFSELAFEFPDLPTQRRIAAVLGALDDKIENNRKICENLEAQAQALFKSWFVDFEPWGGKMPEGWKKGKLRDIAGYDNRRIAASNLTVETYFSTENMLTDRGGVVAAASIPQSGEVPLCEEGSVLVSNIRPYFKKIYRATETAGHSADVLCFEAKDSSWQWYLYRLLWDDAFFAYVMSGVKGCKMPRGDKEQILDYGCVIPGADNVAEFNAVVEPMCQRITHCNKESRALAEMRDALLPQLMSGRLRVDATACQGEIDVGKVEI